MYATFVQVPVEARKGSPGAIVMQVCESPNMSTCNQFESLEKLGSSRGTASLLTTGSSCQHQQSHSNLQHVAREYTHRRNEGANGDVTIVRVAWIIQVPRSNLKIP